MHNPDLTFLYPVIGKWHSTPRIFE